MSLNAAEALLNRRYVGLNDCQRVSKASQAVFCHFSIVLPILLCLSWLERIGRLPYARRGYPAAGRQQREI